MTHSSLPNVLVVGTGEYVTGYVHGSQSKSDKPIGVVSVTLFDLRRRGKINKITLCGTNGTKFPEIRQQFQKYIAEAYKDMDTRFESFPADDIKCDPEAYKRAILGMTPHRDICMVFTPDHTHFQIALEAARHGLHVLVAKPLVQTLEHHVQLLQEAQQQGVLIGVEVHKRWDPLYADAWAKIRNTAKFGDFSFFQSYMSQPSSQLDTFSSWAKNSDISYYLNAHHIDYHCWCVAEKETNKGEVWRPMLVTASGSSGFAKQKYPEVEYDSITLLVQWGKFSAEGDVVCTGSAVYTSSWIGQKGDVYSQQRFFYQGTKSEVNIDQAHRGYTQTTESDGFQSVNPLFMKYTPDPQGRFYGQTGYGYRSFEAFVECVSAVNTKQRTVQDIVETGELASIQSNSTILTSAILNAGRLSLDNKSSVRIVFENHLVDLQANPPKLAVVKKTDE